MVDNNETNRLVLSEQLKSWGCYFDEASSGAEALDKLRAAAAEGRSFDIAIVDMQMPKMDGEILGRKIKEDSAIKDTILVMLTSIGRRGDAARMKEIGFSAYLSKPVKQSQLHDCLATVLGIKTTEKDDPSKHFVTRHTIAEVQTGKLQILLAEDNEMNQKVAVNILKKMGHRVVVANNGKEAVKAFEDGNYDLILMDGQMPEMDGFEATSEIRKKENGTDQHIPIVAFTAHAMKGDREKFISSGMDDYITKPLIREFFVEVITRCVKKTEKLKLEPGKQEAKRSVCILVAEDNPVNQKLAKVVLTKAGYQVEVANNGKEAIEKFTGSPGVFDLILMDVQMPEVGGLEATMTLRDKGYDKIPIVAMTAHEMKSDRTKCFEAGMDDYITKPIKKELVFEMVEKWVFDKEVS